jgi:hypothetical protein
MLRLLALHLELAKAEHVLTCNASAMKPLKRDGIRQCRACTNFVRRASALKPLEGIELASAAPALALLARICHEAAEKRLDSPTQGMYTLFSQCICHEAAEKSMNSMCLLFS